MAGKFTRFSEKRDTVISDVTTYDDVVDGIEPDESAGLHIPIAEDNVGFKIIQKMGWESGRGLGRKKQGRTDPVPLRLKDDFMGLGRFQHELDLAVEATEKRKQLEIEKEITPGLIHKYKSQMDREKTIAESTSDLRQSYYCELCDKQYNKYSEYDNHLNSYDHHHRQRLKNLKEYEVGRKFGAHKIATEDPTKTASAHIVALERAEMRAQRKLQPGETPSFKPMGYRHSKYDASLTVITPIEASNAAITSALRKRSSEEIMESEKKIAEKKARLEKYGVKFQSAGHLATINEKESSPLSSYQASLFDVKDNLKDIKDGTDTHHRDSSNSNNTNSLYGGRFVSSLNDKERLTDKEKDKERDKRLSSLPQAKGRKSEQLAAVKAATTKKEEEEDGSDNDEGFVFGKRKIESSFGKPKVKLPVKQMSLKLKVLGRGCLQTWHFIQPEEKKMKAVVFERRKPFVSELYDRDPNIRSICQVAITSVIFSLVSIIVSDSVKAGKLHWEIFHYIDSLTIDVLISAIVVDFCLHLALITVHPLFNLWRSLRAWWSSLVDAVFFLLYISAVVSSFITIIWACSYFKFPKYFRVALTVEQLRVCMKSYSFIRENAYKVLYPWHKDDTSGPAVWYSGQMSPTVGSFKQYCYFLFAPTLLYRDHYPRDQSSIRWKIVFANLCLFIGGLTVALQIYTKMQIHNFQWLNLVYSFMATLPASLVMLSTATASTMHGWMNMWGELTRFSDRRYYEDWWCSTTYQEYYRKWNIIPYHFNHQYVYKDIRRSVKSPVIAIFILILASSLVHEYIIAVSMGFCIPVLTVLFAGIGVIVVACRVKGTHVVLLTLFFGFHLMVWSYFIENNARRVCQREETLIDLFYPRVIECVRNYSI